MNKKAKKTMPVSAELMEAAEAIARIKGEDIMALTDQFLQNYVMENMAVLLSKVKQLDIKSEPVSDDARSEN